MHEWSEKLVILTKIVMNNEVSKKQRNEGIS